MDKKELEYRKEMARWYVNEGKRQLQNLPFWVQGLLVGLTALVLIFVLALLWQGIKPESTPENPQPTVTVDTTPAAVPDLKLMDRLVAEKKLSDMGFSSLSVKMAPEYSDNSPETIVISQTPAPGTVIRKDETVTLIYGSKALYEKGQKSVTMPSVNGLTLANAKAELQKLGFVKIVTPIENSMDEARLVVVEQTPVKDAKATLNDEVTLKSAPGFQWKEVQAKLAKGFAPYSTFSKVEQVLPEGGGTSEDIKLTLALNEKELTSEALLSERARSYKLGIEQVLERKIGRVLLVNPGVEAVGDSDKAARRVTEDGLTIATARFICDGEAGTRGMTLNWTPQTLKETVEAHQMVLSVVARTNDSGIESVVTCTVSGSDAAPKLVKYEVQ